MVPNQSEDKVLAKYFKHFDLDNTDFVKTLDKIGVVLGKIVDIQNVFNHYDTERTGYLDYKKFAFSLFNSKIQENKTKLPKFVVESRNKMGFESNMMKDSHFIKLHNFLKSKSRNGLINFYKEFKTLDYNNSNRLGIDEFIKIVTTTKIPLNSNEIQLLFHQYEKNNNSYFFYEELFKDLITIYHNKNRELFLANFYISKTEEMGRLIKLNDLKSLYNPKKHMEYLQNVTLEDLSRDFSDLIETFQFLLKFPKKEQNLSKENFIEFFKFFGFGIENDQTFFEYISDLFVRHEENENSTEKIQNENYKNSKTNEQTLEFDNKRDNYSEENKGRNSKNVETELKYKTIDNHTDYIQLKKELVPNSKSTVHQSKIISDDPISLRLKKNLQSYGRRCLFALINQFKYYDNGTRFVNKFDFAKVMKDFRLNLTITEIEKLFSTFSNKNDKLNYDEFIKTLSINSLNDERKFLIQQIYEKLIRISEKKKVDLKLMKSIFNSRNHPIKKDENEIYSEYFECLEMFLYSYMNRRSSEISYEDFEEFHRFSAFLVEDDEIFKKILLSEWKNILNKPEETKVKSFEEVKQTHYKTEEKSIRTQVDNRNNNQETHQNNHQNRLTTPISRDKSVRSSTPIQRTLSSNDKETALAQNQYNKNRAVRLIDPLIKLKEKLKNRGIRGLMNLHKQFLLNCSNINAISYGDFVKVLSLQRIELSKEEYQLIFDKFVHDVSNSDNPNGKFLNFSGFIRNFKKILSSVRLEYVEKAFIVLDIEGTEMLLVDDIKLKFNGSNHPDVLRNIRSEDNVIVEFLDCFELNYNFLAANENPHSSNLVSFEEFANFYEYVSFIYDNDDEFVNLIKGAWDL